MIPKDLTIGSLVHFNSRFSSNKKCITLILNEICDDGGTFVCDMFVENDSTRYVLKHTSFLTDLDLEKNYDTVIIV